MTTTNQISPEVPEKPKRRRFTAEYKHKILDEIDRSHGNIGNILRREGLYSSQLAQWKRWRNSMGEGGSKSIHNENAKLKRENERLKLKLKKAEGLIDLQKKIADIMNLSQNDEKSES